MLKTWKKIKNACKRLIKNFPHLQVFTQVTSPHLCDVSTLQQVS